MQKKFVLSDLRGFCCLSYFIVVSKSKASEMSVSIIGNREDGDKTYCNLSCKANSNAVKLYENSLLTISEPITVIITYPDNQECQKCQAQINTDTVMTAGGKVILHYSITMDFESDTQTAMVFELTGWKSLTT